MQHHDAMTQPPTGTVTFLFTDIEGSTQRWDEQPDAMRAALAQHDLLLRLAIEANAGQVFKTVGDAFCAAFATAGAGLAAAIEAQRALTAEDGSRAGHNRETGGVCIVQSRWEEEPACQLVGSDLAPRGLVWFWLPPPRSCGRSFRRAHRKSLEGSRQRVRLLSPRWKHLRLRVLQAQRWLWLPASHTRRSWQSRT